MSKAFLKDDAPAEGVVVLARPPLPPGSPNYVTERGLALLQAEHAALSAERARLGAGQGEGSELEQARNLGALLEQLDELVERLGSAQVFGLQARDTVGFGATVTTQTLSGRFAGEIQRLQLVGVDEAASATDDATAKDDRVTRIAFTAPIAQALSGHRVGEQVTFRTPRGKQVLEVVALGYEQT